MYVWDNSQKNFLKKKFKKKNYYYYFYFLRNFSRFILIFVYYDWDLGIGRKYLLWKSLNLFRNLFCWAHNYLATYTSGYLKHVSKKSQSGLLMLIGEYFVHLLNFIYVWCHRGALCRQPLSIAETREPRHSAVSQAKFIIWVTQNCW